MNNKLNKKRYFIIAGLVILASIIVSVLKIIGEVEFSKASNVIVDQMEKLEGKSLQMEYTNGETKYVDNFDISKDTLPFKNFSTTKSMGGNCEGFSAFELLTFEGKLQDKINIDRNLSEYHIESNDIQKVYGKDEKYEYQEAINEDIKKNKSDDISIDGSEKIFRNLIKQAVGKSSVEKTKNREQYFNETKLENGDVEAILMNISEIHESKEYCVLETMPYYPSEIDNIKDIQENKNYKTLDPNVITQKIDNNKLVEIGITNTRISGHALLVYGYEIVNKNNIKFYVCDSNLPINYNQSTDINNEIKKKEYVLFTKDILGDNWSFIYEPNINGKKPYFKYNSFLPGTKFAIYDI